VGCSGLQWVAVGCNGWQRVAVGCSVWIVNVGAMKGQLVEMVQNTIYCNTLQHTALHCNILQLILQHTDVAAPQHILQHTDVAAMRVGSW